MTSNGDPRIDPRNPRVKLVCFDLGEVLVKLAGSWPNACRLADVAWRGTDPTREELARIRDIVVRHEIGQLAQADFSAQTAALFSMQPDDVHRVFTCWLQGPYPGVLDLLDQLHELPVQTACLSNTNEHHWQLMMTPGDPNYLPLERMDYQFASHLIGARKPDAAIYAHVEEATGLAPSEIVFFDNAPQNVRGALARGWHAHQIDPKGDTAAQIEQHLQRYDLG